MVLNKRLLLALGMSGWATLAIVRAARKNAQRQEQYQQRKTQLSTWENEGGNLPPSASPAELESLPRRS
jgi:hypothetical protein